MARQLTQRGRERRRQLIEYAAKRFADNGYHPTSVAEIVSGLGVGKGVFYWYFDSKEELFREILREAMRGLRRDQQRAIEGVEDPVHRIELGIRATMRWSAENPEFYKLSQFAVTEETFLPALRRGQEIAVADVARHVRDGIDQGRLRDLEPETIAHAILGVCSQLARVFVHEQHRPHDEVADSAVTLVLDGVLVPTTTAAV